MITLPGTDKQVSIARAKGTMATLTEEYTSLRDDDSSAAKSRRVEIGRQLRAIAQAIDATCEMVEVVIAPDASKQFPFRIGPKEFWPGTHLVRSSVAETLSFMMDQHRRVETNRIIAGGNAQGDSLGRELPTL